MPHYRVPDYSSLAGLSAHNRDVVAPPPDCYEAALRRLPDAHSLALRLRDAGVDDEVICRYLQIEGEGLETLILIARNKLAAELSKR